MPLGYEHLLNRLLKTEIQELDESTSFNRYTDGPAKYKTIIHPTENNEGVPQGGIISPLLMN